MAEKPNKTEQGRQKRAAEKSARAAATKGRRDSAAAAQERSEQRKGRNVDEGSAGRDASFAAREANAGLTLAGNSTKSSGRGGSGPSFADREAANGLTNTTSGRVASRATNPDFPPVGTPLGNDEFVATNNVGGGGGGFNGSVLICINGEPYYIDIPYDESVGAYPESDGANFTINIGPPT